MNNNKNNNPKLFGNSFYKSLFSSILFILVFASTPVIADTDRIVDKINITVPVSCTMSGTGMNTHNTSIQNGTYVSDIGTTTLKASCNDKNGFTIYASGYTGDEVGGTNSNKLIGTPSQIGNIATGTATSAGNPDVSNWAMKLTAVSTPTPTYPITISNGFDSYHEVPNEYTKVATRLAGTDIGIAAEGSTLNTTYAAYISKTQGAGTYSGKVIYTLVHPNTIPIPKMTMLDTGQVVNGKMKTLAAGAEKAYNDKTSDIKAIRMADSLPSGFTPSEANTVSTSTSKHPIYIFFDNTNDAGIMYFYTGGYQVVMNPDSSHLFRSNLSLSDISGLTDWDSSNVTTMLAIFVDSVVELTDLNALARWDTSNVENLQGALMLNYATAQTGYRSSLSDISALANWNTDNATNMQQLFYNNTLLSDITALSNWNTSRVTNMYGLFSGTAINNVDAISNWDVSSVENMQLMFAIAGGENELGIISQLSDISGLSSWDTGNVTDMSAMFQYAIRITNITSLANWDVSSVTSMRNMFNGNSSLISIDALANWNVSGVEDMRYMFKDASSLTDATSIAGWDISGVTATAGGTSSSANYFYHMFRNSPATKAPFTLRAGTWNSAGTYVPSS